MESPEKKGKIVKLLTSINKNLSPPLKTSYADEPRKRDYIGSFTLCGDEIPKELDAEYGEEYIMKVKVRVSEVGDNYGEKKEKRVELKIKKITDIEELGEEDKD